MQAKFLVSSVSGTSTRTFIRPNFSSKGQTKSLFPANCLRLKPGFRTPHRTSFSVSALEEDVDSDKSNAVPAAVETTTQDAGNFQSSQTISRDTNSPANDEYEEEDTEYVTEVGNSPFPLEQLQGLDYKGFALKAGAVFLGVTFVVALFRTVRKYATPRAARKRKVNKNKLLVDRLAEYLPARRSELNSGTCKMLMFQTGFTGTEVFRKYLWFLLRERKFDTEAMEDLVQLRSALGLTDEQVAEAVRERSQRIYDKYGTLIMNAAGMTSEGAARKATGRALFSKLLYLAESGQLLPQESEAAKSLNVPEIFGATERDADRLRIVSLHEVDLDKLDAMVSEDDNTDDPPKAKSGQ